MSNLSFDYANNKNDKEIKKFTFLSPTRLERQLEYSLDKQIKNYTLLGINEPFYYYVNLVGVMGVTGWDRGRHYGLPPQEIDDDFLQLSDVIVESRDYESYKKVYEQAVSSLWNAYGFTEEPSDYK